MDCVVNPPKPGDPSYDLWIKVNLYYNFFFLLLLLKFLGKK